MPVQSASRSRGLPRHGTAAVWTAENPFLDVGEVGVEDDTRRTKRGPGRWNALPYGDGTSYDLSIQAVLAATARASGTGTHMGVKLQRPVTFSQVQFRGNTADASGNLVVELTKNGTTVSGTSTTIAFGSQVAGATTTGSWSFVAGDVVQVKITGVGGTPGNGLIADLKGVATG